MRRGATAAPAASGDLGLAAGSGLLPLLPGAGLAAGGGGASRLGLASIGASCVGLRILLDGLGYALLLHNLKHPPAEHVMARGSRVHDKCNAPKSAPRPRRGGSSLGTCKRRWRYCRT